MVAVVVVVVATAAEAGDVVAAVAAAVEVGSVPVSDCTTSRTDFYQVAVAVVTVVPTTCLLAADAGNLPMITA